MAIKRYLPRYRKLLRSHRPLWYEKRIKLRKFEKQKWQRAKGLYYPRKLKFYRQDASSLPVARFSNVDRTIRLRKTYKFLLRDKQRLQLYYGGRRLRFFQLKNLARKLKNRKLSKGMPHSKAFLSLLENRLDVVLYRFCVVNSLAQARKIIQTGRVKVNSCLIKNPAYILNPDDILLLDPFLKNWSLGTFMKKTFPYFFYRHKKKRRLILGRWKEVLEQGFSERKVKKIYTKVKSFILQLKEKKENGSVSKKKKSSGKDSIKNSVKNSAKP